MPRPKAAIRRCRQISANNGRTSTGQFLKVLPASTISNDSTHLQDENWNTEGVDFGDDDDNDDDFESELTDAFDNFGTFSNDSGSCLRKAYTGDSRWSVMRSNQRKAALAASMKGSPAITSYFTPCLSAITPVNNDFEDDQQRQQGQSIDRTDFEKLHEIQRSLVEAIDDFGPVTGTPKEEKAPLMRLFAVKSYITALLDGPDLTTTEASIKSAKLTFKGRSHTSDQRHRASAVRKWADEFVENVGSEKKRKRSFKPTRSLKPNTYSGTVA